MTFPVGDAERILRHADHPTDVVVVDLGKRTDVRTDHRAPGCLCFKHGVAIDIIIRGQKSHVRIDEKFQDRGIGEDPVEC